MRRAAAFAAILRKDLLLMTRDGMFIALTVLAITTFVALYYLLPSEVQPGFTLGVRGPELQPIFEQLVAEQEEPVPIVFHEEEEALFGAVERREIDVGISFPHAMLEAIRAGERATVTVYVTPALPVEYRDAVHTIVREIAFALAGYELPVTEPDEQTVIVGPDVGPVPLRDRMRPLYAFMVLIMEAIALGALISAEIQQKTLSAIVVTPARTSDVLLSKGVLGTFVAFTEAAIVLFIIRGFGPSPGLVLFALVLGAMLVTGVAMIAGSAGKDLWSTMVIGIVMLIPLAIPAFSSLFPGTTAGWVRVIPSYGLVSAISAASIYGAGWADVAADLAVLAGWVVAFALAGIAVLRRRIRAL